MAAPRGHIGPGGNCAQDVAAGLLHRLLQRQPQRQVGRNGGRQRAPGAMPVVRGNARRLKLVRLRCTGHRQHIHHPIAGQVPAFEQHRLRAQRTQVLRGGLQRIGVLQAAAQQPARFVQVGRDHLGQREQLTHQHAHGLLRNQAVATGGHHHRVQHHMGQLVGANGIGHHAHHVGRMQHADLDRIHANVLHHGIDLGLEHVGRHAMDARDAAGVLRGDGGDGRHAVAAQGAEGFEIGLDACAAAAV